MFSLLASWGQLASQDASPVKAGDREWGGTGRGEGEEDIDGERERHDHVGEFKV
jgi:hypothetical protein